MTELGFSAVVGQDDAKLALLLAAAQPRLGGVLLRGQKGSAKTTLARGLAALLPGRASFVELPLAASEDSVLGSLDLAGLLSDGSQRFRPGLLAGAHGGVLYVDEINLLADHLVDALLDVATSGINRVEREGISYEHPARFVLIGSMNPEEGELRPQLLDRFGFAVDVVAPVTIGERVAAVRRQLDAENTGVLHPGDAAADTVLRDRLTNFMPAALDDAMLSMASAVALHVGCEGLRADLMLCRAAAALAGWESRTNVTVDDLRRVAPLVLAHRRRRGPFDEPGVTPEELDDAFASGSVPDDAFASGSVPDDAFGSGSVPDDAFGSGSAPPTDLDLRSDDGSPPDPHEDDPTLPTQPILRLEGTRHSASSSSATPGRRARTQGATGRVIRARTPAGDPQSIALGATAMAVAVHRTVEPAAPLRREDLREAVREQRSGALIVVVLDASRSMGAQARIRSAQSAVLGLLTDAYQRRDRVALIAVSGATARLVLRPTGAIEIARARLDELAASGATPLASGLDLALSVINDARDGREPLLVVITDGRATAADNGADPVAASQVSAGRLAAAAISTVVVDAEVSTPRLGLAHELAATMGATYVSLDPHQDHQVEGVIRTHLERRMPRAGQ